MYANIVNCEFYLTLRENEILVGLASGLCCKQIGREQTVKSQMFIIRKKLNAFTNAQAVANAIRRGLID